MKRYFDGAEVHWSLHNLVVVLETQQVSIYWLIERPCIPLQRPTINCTATIYYCNWQQVKITELFRTLLIAFSALTLLVGQQEGSTSL